MALTVDDLATAAGTSSADVERMAAAGLLGGTEGFESADVARVRLIHALEATGVPSPWIESAVRRGSISLDFVDLLMPDTVSLTKETQAQVTERSHLSPQLKRAVRAVLGTLSAEDTDPVRRDDVRVMEIADEACDMGASDEQVARILRVTSDTAARLVAAQRDFIDEVVLASALSGAGREFEVIRESAPMRLRYRDLGMELFEVLYRRTVEAAVFQSLVEMIQLGLTRAGVRLPGPAVQQSVAFADVSGFTRIAEERGDSVAAEVASRFAGLAQEVAAIHGGTVVKLLGDGALLRFPDATRAVKSLHTLCQRMAREELPPVHGGIDAGPVVRRDGDIFGTVVNLAARASSRAGPGEVLVTETVVDEWAGEGVEFREKGTMEIRGLTRPVRLYRISTPR